jgi:hypothetical protein
MIIAATSADDPGPDFDISEASRADLEPAFADMIANHERRPEDDPETATPVYPAWTRRPGREWVKRTLDGNVLLEDEMPSPATRRAELEAEFRKLLQTHEAPPEQHRDTVIDMGHLPRPSIARQAYPAPDQFAASLAKLCEATSVSVREIGKTVYLINVRFSHQKATATKRKGLGPMARKHEERA